MIRRINDRRMVWIQLSQSIDQRKGFRCAAQAGVTDRMIPHQSGDVGVKEKRSNRGHTGIQREFRPSTQIEHALLRIRRRCLGVKKRPAAIKDRLSQFFRDIDRRQIRGAERGDEQDELEIRHSGILNIERGHGRSLSGERPRESTIVSRKDGTGAGS